jgi:hypothetical protein
LMAAEIKQSFIALWTAQFLQGFSHDAFVRQRDRLAELQAFIDGQYAVEIKRGQHGGFRDVIAAVMYYLGKERELKAGEVAIRKKHQSAPDSSQLGWRGLGQQMVNPAKTRKTLERRKANRKKAAKR